MAVAGVGVGPGAVPKVPEVPEVPEVVEVAEVAVAVAAAAVEAAVTPPVGARSAAALHMHRPRRGWL